MQDFTKVTTNSVLSCAKASECIKALGLELPPAKGPIATYTRFRKVGSIVHLSGQGSIFADGEGIFGKVGRDIDVEDGVKAAHMTALNILAQAQLICDGDLNRILQWTKLTGYINCVDNFTEHPTVLDGATQLLEAVFGEAGLVARTAIGVSSLPMNIAVEIQVDFELRP